MSQGEKRDVLEQRESEVFCTTLILFNVSLQCNIQHNYAAFS